LAWGVWIGFDWLRTATGGAYLNSDKTLLSESLEAGASVKGTFSLDARQYTASCYTCHTLRHCDHRSCSVIKNECNSVLTEVVTAARSAVG
jgi:hypothetical protein